MPVIIDGTLGVNAAAVTTTSWNPTNLVIPGNSTIGDSTSDILTINAGSLNFNQTGQRITGDFSNGTAANRVSVQSSTTNGATLFNLIPNGTSVTSTYYAWGGSDTANAPVLLVGQTTVAATINSTKTGTGAYTDLTITTGGIERLRIGSGGGVSIGSTTTTDSKFMVTGPSGQTSHTGTAYGTVLLRASSASGEYTNLDFASTGSWPVARIGMLYTNSGSYLQFGTSNNYGNGITNTSMSIDYSGNIGVGINSPVYKLHLYKNASESNQLYVQNASTGTASYSAITSASNTNESTFRSYGSNFNTFSHAGIALAGWTEIWGGTLSSPGPSGLLLGVDSASPLVFATNNIERVRVDASGNVGVGCSPTNSSLSITKNKNLSFQWNNTYNYANIFCQESSAALVLSSGYQFSSTGNGYASSVPVAWPKSAISLTGGTIFFYNDATTTAAVGTDMTPTQTMRIEASGRIAFGLGSASAAGRVSSASDTYASYVAMASSAGQNLTVDALKVTDLAASYYANARYTALSHTWWNSSAPTFSIQNNADQLSYSSSGSAYGVGKDKVIPMKVPNYPSPGVSGTWEDYYQPAVGESGYIMVGNVNNYGGEYRYMAFVYYSRAQSDGNLTIVIDEKIGSHMLDYQVAGSGSSSIIQIKNTYGYGTQVVGRVFAVSQ